MRPKSKAPRVAEVLIRCPPVSIVRACSILKALGPDSCIAPHTPNFHISGPMSFQHITHTSPQHFSKMKNSHSQNDLLAEFSAVRASQVPQRALRGIRAGEIHSRSPSVDTFDRTLASKDSRESMASSVAPSPTAMQNPKSSASLPSPTHHWHRLRHPPGNLPPWTATRLSLHGYGTNSPTHSPTSPHHIPPEEVGLAVPLEDGRGWHHPYADDDNPSQSGDGDHGFHAVSTPGETAWELAPNSPLPFDLLPSLCEEDESSSRPVSSVTTINRGSVIHRGHNGAATNNSTGRLPTNSRLANGDETLSGIPIMEMDEGDRVVSVIHHPPQQASLDGAATADEGLFSSWNAESDTESVADGEALLEWVSPGHRWSKEPDAASSPSSRAKSWRDSQASTIPNSGPDDYNKLLDEIAELNGPISAWHVDSAPVTNTPLARGQSHIPAANAYPMSPEDGDEPPAFDPYTAPLPHRPDSLSSQTATGRPEARVSSMQSHGTSPRLSGDKSKPKRTSSTSKRVAFVEDKAEPIKKNGTPVSKIPRPVRRHGSSTSSITFEADRNAPVAVPDLPETELSWVTHQRHSTGQVQRSKSTGHSRKLSSPDTARTSPHRRSNSSRSNRDAVTTATNAGYSFVRISGPAATRVSS